MTSFIEVILPITESEWITMWANFCSAIEVVRTIRIDQKD